MVHRRFATLGLLATLALLAASAGADPEASVDERLARADAALAAHRPAEAASELRGAMSALAPLDTRAVLFVERFTRASLELLPADDPATGVARLAAARALVPPDARNALERIALDRALVRCLLAPEAQVGLPREPEDELLGRATSPRDEVRTLLEEIATLDSSSGHELAVRSFVAAAQASPPHSPEVLALAERALTLGNDPDALVLAASELAALGREPEAAARLAGATSPAARALALSLRAPVLALTRAGDLVHLRYRNVESIEVVARPIALETALDDALAALRGEGEGLDLVSLAAAGKLEGAVAGAEIALVTTHVAASTHPAELVFAAPAGGALLIEARSPGAAPSRTLLARTGLVLLAARHEEGVALALCDARSGAPVTGRITLVQVADEIRDVKSLRFTASSGLPTDEQGFAFAPLDARFSRVFAVAHADGGGVAWVSEPLESSPRADPERTVVAAFFERAHLRKGESARARIVVRRPRTDAGHRILVRPGTDEKVQAFLVDAAGKELAQRELTLDTNGSAAFEAPLPPAFEGRVRLLARLMGEPALTRSGECLVAEPRTGTLEVELTGPAWAPPGSAVHLALEARDALGGPVAFARVDWRAVTGPASDAGREPGARLLALTPPPLAPPVTLGDSVATDASGNATITVPAPRTSHDRLVVRALVRDVSGREGVARASVLLASSVPRLELGWERRFLAPGEEFALDVTARGLDGKPLEVVKGMLEVRKQGALVSSSEIATNKEGRVRGKVKIADPGTYEVAFVGSGSPARGGTRVIVLTREGGLGSPCESLDVIPERESYTSGETARFLVTAPGPRALDHALIFARDERGRVRAGFPRSVSLASGAALIEIPLDATWSPGIELEVTRPRDGAVERARTRVHVGQVEDLNVEITADKPLYKPGEKPVVRVRVHGTDGLPQRGAGVALSLEDEDAAAASEALLPGDVPLLARRHAAPPPAGNFIGLGTDDNGLAQTTLTLPDTPTRLRVRARVLARDGRFGAASHVIFAKRRLALDAGVPLTLELGDEPVCSVTIRNDGEKLASATISIASGSPDVLSFEGESSHRYDVPAHGSATLHVKAHAKKAGRAKVEAKLAFPGEDETQATTVIVAGPALVALEATAAAIGSDTAPVGSADLIAPVASHVLLRIESPAATLGDLVAELAAGDPALAFAPVLLARRALENVPFEAIAKRHGVDPAATLAPREPSKVPRDPRRNPLFSKVRVTALAQEGQDALAARATPAGYSWRAGGEAELEATTAAVEALARAKEAGATVTPEALARGATALAALLEKAEARPGPARAEAAHALVLAGHAAPIEKILASVAPEDRESRTLLALAAVRAAGTGPDAARASEAAWKLLGGIAAPTAACAARELELVLALAPTGPLGRAVADEAVALRPRSALEDPRGAAALARALAEYVRLAKPPAPGGTLAVGASGKRVAELKLAEDDPLLTDAAVVLEAKAPLGTLALTRPGSGRVRFAAIALGAPVTATLGRRVEALERTLTTEHDARWLRARWGEGPLRTGQLVRFELVLLVTSPLEHVILEQPLPGGFDALGSARLAAERLAPGEHRFVILARPSLAGSFALPPARLWVGGVPALAGSELRLRVE